MRPATKGSLILAIAVLSFSVMSALAKMAGNDIPSIEIVFFRGLFSMPIILFLSFKSGISLRGKRRGLLLMRSLSGTIALFMFFFAVTRIPVANALLLNQTAPIFILPMAAIFLREHITRTHTMLAVIALIGAGFVLKPGTDFDNFPGMMALASAFFTAIAYVLVRKLTETEHTLTIVVWFTTIGTLLSIPLMVPVFVLPDLKNLIVLIGVGILATIGQLLMTKAYSYGEAGRLAVIGSMGAVFGAGFDLVLWQHIPDLWTVSGSVMVIASCSLIQILKRFDKPVKPA